MCPSATGSVFCFELISQSPRVVIHHQLQTALRIQVLGMARIANDVTPELALATIESISVLGAFQASPAVRSALIDRFT